MYFCFVGDPTQPNPNPPLTSSGIFDLVGLAEGQVREATAQELHALARHIPEDVAVRGNAARKGIHGTSTDARKASLRLKQEKAALAAHNARAPATRAVP